MFKVATRKWNQATTAVIELLFDGAILLFVLGSIAVTIASGVANALRRRAQCI